jgi:threonine synthase
MGFVSLNISTLINHPGLTSMSQITHLECSKCGAKYDVEQIQTVCNKCGKPLFARYDLEKIKEMLTKRELVGRVSSMWRYREILPVRKLENIVTLGEDWTPLTPTPRLSECLGLRNVLVKDEGVIPTGSFKARGLSAAVSKAKELGVKRVAIPSAGNAGGAMAAYGARAGLEVYIFMPEDAPKVNAVESDVVGAKIVLVKGLISDAGRLVRDGTQRMGWFNMATLAEPYRVEGKKTMGLEVAEQLDWKLPDVIIYPTGGGTGIIGMWKVFDELEEMGWISHERPRMISVQAEGCSPIVKAYEEEKEESEFYEGARTVASGLRVPKALGDFLILRAVRESGGAAIAVTDEELMADVRLISRLEGIFACPEGAATVSALRKMVEDKKVDRDERVVLFNTGSGLKYTDLFTVDAPIADPKFPFDYGSLK